MNISPKHGGGITLKRVLGDDVYNFDNYILTAKYPVDGFESDKNVVNKEIRLWQTPGEFQQKDWPKRFSFDYLIFRLKMLLGLPNPEFFNWDYYKAIYVKFLEESLHLDNCTFLVVPQGVISVILMNELHRKFKIPYLTWIMDDTRLEYDSVNDRFHYPYPDFFETEFKYHLQNAKQAFTISDNLGEFYKSRFSIEYKTLFGPADVGGVKEKKIRKSSEKLKLCFFGRAWTWPLDAIEKFSEKLEYLNAELHIFSYYPLVESLLSNPRVMKKEPLALDEVYKKMQEYDAIMIFYGFDPEVRNYSQFNISTKMSESLTSGLPAIFVGPEYGAMTDWARKNDCGIIITDPENVEQLENIKKIRSSDNSMEIILKCQYAAKMLSTKRMRNTWIQAAPPLKN